MRSMIHTTCKCAVNLQRLSGMNECPWDKCDGVVDSRAIEGNTIV